MTTWLRSRWAVLAIILLTLLGLGFAHHAVFHAWHASGSSTHPEWHRQSALRFVLLMCACFAPALFLAVLRRRARRAG